MLLFQSNSMSIPVEPPIGYSLKSGYPSGCFVHFTISTRLPLGCSRAYQAGLRLESIETRIVECPFARDFRQHGDAEKFAAAYVPTISSWNESTFLAGLATERPLPERRSIIDNYYERYRRLVAADPEGHAMDYVHAYMVISKQPG